MKKLTKLTDKQNAAIPAHNKKWIALGLSTEPANFEIFERAVKECYKFAGLNINIPIVRVKNPVVGAFAATLADKILSCKSVGGAVSEAVRKTVRGAVRKAIGEAVGEAVDGAVGGAVSEAVDGAVDEAV